MQIPLQAILLAIFIHSLWGGNPVAVKFGLLVFPPLWSAFIRFVIGIACICIWAKYKGIAIWPRHREWPVLLVLGLIFTAQIATMNYGIDQTTGSMAAILISTNPIFAALCAHVMIPGDRLTVIKILGLLLALIGTTLTLLQGQSVEAFTNQQSGQLDYAVQRSVVRVSPDPLARNYCVISMPYGSWSGKCSCHYRFLPWAACFGKTHSLGQSGLAARSGSGLSGYRHRRIGVYGYFVSDEALPTQHRDEFQCGCTRIRGVAQSVAVE